MAQLEISVDGHLGVIALNRPEAINALSRQMIDGISAQLAAWRDDPEVRAVLFEGRGARGFCAGGDVRAVRELILGGDRNAAADYFGAEYAMDLAIATYPKPVISLADGIVMGGGIGIASHAAFRFTTPKAQYAMPEAGIGFVCDVGVNFILARAPLHRALLFLMTGLPVGAGDALALGLADCAVSPEVLPEVRAGVRAAADAGNIDQAIVSFMQVHSIEPGEASLCLLADRLADDLSEETAEDVVADILEAAESDPEVAMLARTLGSRSPTSLEAIFRSHHQARRLQDVEKILALDLKLASLVAGLPDFAEGVRAVLVDKDRRPRWDPPGFGGAPHHAISLALGEETRHIAERVSTS